MDSLSCYRACYPQQRPAVAGTFVVLIGVLELLQLMVRGRHTRLQDYVVDVLAALIVVDLRGHGPRIGVRQPNCDCDIGQKQFAA